MSVPSIAIMQPRKHFHDRIDGASTGAVTAAAGTRPACVRSSLRPRQIDRRGRSARSLCWRLHLNVAVQLAGKLDLAQMELANAASTSSRRGLRYDTWV